MIDVLRWIAASLVTIAVLGAALITALISRRAAHTLFVTWGRTVRRIFGVSVSIEDRRTNSAPGPKIFLNLNQTSLIESIVSHDLLGFRYRVFANVEYLLLPFLGWMVLALGAIVVVRQWPGQRRRAVERAIERLRAGDSLYMSIEGRRSDGPLLPYKTGAVRIALGAGARLVPVVFHGARDRLPRGHWRVRPGRVRLVVLEEISTAGLTADDVRPLVAHLRGLAEAELSEPGGDSTMAAARGTS